jgi:hypothetical protein
MAQQRFMSGLRVAEAGCREGARFETLWQQTVASIPFYRRLVIALWIVIGKWGSWKGSGTADYGIQVQPEAVAQ